MPDAVKQSFSTFSKVLRLNNDGEYPISDNKWPGVSRRKNSGVLSWSSGAEKEKNKV